MPLLLLVILMSGSVAAREVPRDLTTTDLTAFAAAIGCLSCHGDGGRSPGAMPSLAGKSQDYLERAMKAYRDGTRPATLMNRLARGYTDADIARITAYIAEEMQ